MSAQPLSDLVLFVLDNSAFMINEDFQEGTRFKAVSHAVQLLATSFVNRSRRTETRVGFSAIVGAGETPRTIVVASESKIPLCAAVEEQASSCSGEFQLAWSLRLAMLNLKRVPASTCRRVIVLVGSPVTDSDEELLNSATYFRKHNIRVDLIQFTRSSSTPKKRSSTSKPIPLSKTTRKLNLLMNALSESSQRVVVPAGSAQISFKLVDLLMEISEIAPHRSPSWTRWLASSAGKSRLVDSRPSASTRRRPSDRVPIPASPMKMPTLPPVAPMDSCRMDSRFKHSSFEYVCVDIELPTNDVTEGALPRLRTRILEPPSKQYPPRVLFEFRAGRLRVENRKVTPLSRRGRLSLVRFQTDNSLHLQWSDRQRRGVYLDVEIPEASVQLEWVNAGKSTDRIFRVRFLTPSLFECVAASGRIPFRVRPCDRSDELDDSVWEYLLPPPSTVSKSSSPASDPFLNIGVSPEEERQLELEEEGLYTFRPRTQSPIPAAAAEPTACAPTDVAPSAAHSPSAHVSATDRPTSSVTAPRQRPVRLPALLFWVQEPQEEHESVEQILDQINELLRQANQLRQRSAAQRPRLAVLSGGSLGLTPDQLINLFMLSNGQSKSGRPSVAAAAAVVAALDVPANGAGASTLTKKSTRSTRARNPTRSARRSLRAAAAALPPIPPLGQSVRRASPRLGAESGRSARSGASSPSSSATSRGPHTHGGRASSSAEHTYALSPMPSRAHAVAAKTSSTRRAAPRRALPALSSSRLHPQHHRRRQRALGTSSASSTPLSYENGQRPLHSSSSSSSSSSSPSSSSFAAAASSSQACNSSSKWNEELRSLALFSALLDSVIDAKHNRRAAAKRAAALSARAASAAANKAAAAGSSPNSSSAFAAPSSAALRSRAEPSRAPRAESNGAEPSASSPQSGLHPAEERTSATPVVGSAESVATPAAVTDGARESLQALQSAQEASIACGSEARRQLQNDTGAGSPSRDASHVSSLCVVDTSSPPSSTCPLARGQDTSDDTAALPKEDEDEDVDPDGVLDEDVDEQQDRANEHTDGSAVATTSGSGSGLGSSTSCSRTSHGEAAVEERHHRRTCSVDKLSGGLASLQRQVWSTSSTGGSPCPGAGSPMLTRAPTSSERDREQQVHALSSVSGASAAGEPVAVSASGAGGGGGGGGTSTAFLVTSGSGSGAVGVGGDSSTFAAVQSTPSTDAVLAQGGSDRFEVEINESKKESASGEP